MSEGGTTVRTCLFVCLFVVSAKGIGSSYIKKDAVKLFVSFVGVKVYIIMRFLKRSCYCVLSTIAKV